MKVLLNALVISAMLATSNASAQESVALKPVPSKEHHFGLRLDPIWALIGGLGAQTDVRLSNGISLALGGYYIPPRKNAETTSSSSSSSSTYTGYTYKWTAYEVYVSTIIMITGDYDHHGLFIAPGVGYTGAKITEYSPFNLSGSMDVPEARVTVGYNWVVKNFKFTAGGGLRAIAGGEVVIKNSAGDEILRDRASSMGGVAFDVGAGMIF